MGRKVSSKPRRRSYQTGETLPELTDGFRPIPLGLDSTGEPDEAIRAFAVSIRNRSDNPIYVAESPESDGARIDRFESYDIYETNGISRIFLKGTNGGESVTVRTLEAHNDFSIGDKIEGFIRAISHFLTQSKTEAVITAAETNFNTDITSVSDGVTFDTDITSVSDGVSFDTSIGSVANGVTFDTVINDTVGNLDINLNSQTIDNVTTDISAQSIGDIDVLDRRGIEKVRALQDFGINAGEIDVNLGAYLPNTRTWTLYPNAEFDGEIRMVWIRLTPADDTEYTGGKLSDIGFRLTINGTLVSPSVVSSAWSSNRYGETGGESYISKLESRYEVIYGWEPKGGKSPTFQSGDTVELLVGPPGGSAFRDGEPTGLYDVEIEVAVTERTGN